MIPEDEFIAKSKILWRTLNSIFEENHDKRNNTSRHEGPYPDPVVHVHAGPDVKTNLKQNITITFTPEEFLTILVAVGAADNPAILDAARGAYQTDVKPASTIALYPTLRGRAREAGIVH